MRIKYEEHHCCELAIFPPPDQQETNQGSHVFPIIALPDMLF